MRHGRWVVRPGGTLTFPWFAYLDRNMDKINNNTGVIIYLDASGGTGERFLVNLLHPEIRDKQQIALTLASFGIAAVLMEGGRTARSILQLPLNIAEE
ncbi:hypothetical protein EVAR_103451_1 [Eumeta japonica]|uniref:ATP-dependent DNA helicase n=1 Tax=Eumeta variegata TaxID=151549 RepID=A0A4C1Z1P9_EUMVA|nr:hypothetical protein EVAR_103451_1 [Eumeta japonica]